MNKPLDVIDGEDLTEENLKQLGRFVGLYSKENKKIVEIYLILDDGQGVILWNEDGIYSERPKLFLLGGMILKRDFAIRFKYVSLGADFFDQELDFVARLGMDDSVKTPN